MTATTENFTPTLYYYQHCPYCVRVLTTAGLANISLNKVILANDDVATPTQMVGVKMLPILEMQPEQYMGESLDIVNYLSKTYDYPITSDDSLLNEVEDFLSTQRLTLHSLMMAHCVKLPLEEFKTQSAIDFFIDKKTPLIGDFDTAFTNTPKFVAQLEAAMLESESLFEKLTHQPASIEAIMLFSALYGMFYVKDFPWSVTAKDFMQTMGSAAHMPVFGDVCTPV